MILVPGEGSRDETRRDEDYGYIRAGWDMRYFIAISKASRDNYLGRVLTVDLFDRSERGGP